MMELPKWLFAKIEIRVLTPLDGYHQEELEDKIKNLLKKYGVKAEIRSLTTGNEMTVKLNEQKLTPITTQQ